VSAGRDKLSAGVVIVRCHNHRWHYLLLRAYRYWDFPKGAVEAGETPLDAACREVAEESGLHGLSFRWGTVCRETPPYRGGKTARYFLAESADGAVEPGINPELGRPEHHEFRWLGYRPARTLLVPRVQAILDWAHGIVGERCG